MRRIAAVLVALLLLLLFLPAAPASAATCTWTGAASADWGTAANWSCGSVPSATDAVVISGSTAVTLAQPATVASVTLSNFGGTLTLNAPLSATTLTISGNTFGTGTTVTGAALLIAGLTTVNTPRDVTISTSGSLLAQLRITNRESALVRLTDPALAAGGFQSLNLDRESGSNGATLFDTSAATVGALTLSAAALNFSGVLTVTDTLSWTGGGTLGRRSGSTAATRLVLGQSVTGTIGNGAQLYDAALVNNGTLAVSGALPSMNSANTRAQLVNNGTLTLNVAADSFSTGNGDLVNAGTLRKLGAGQLQLGLGLPVRNHGLLEVAGGLLRFNDSFVQTAGELRLSGGAVQGNNQYAYLQLDGGALTGSGIITDSIRNNGGTVAPTGIIDVYGGYTQGVTGTLAITVSGQTAGRDFGQLRLMRNQGVGGSAAVGGQLRANRAAGFRPAAGDRFAIISCAESCSGNFASSSGSLTPAFGGFAGNSEVFLAEPASAALLSLVADRTSVQRGERNSYTLKILNPTGQPLAVGGLRVTLPLSFTYQLGTTSGALTSNPFDAPNSAAGTRQLSWSGGFSVPAGGSASVRFSVQLDQNIPVGSYPLGVQLNVGGAPVSYGNLAEVGVPLGAATQLAVGAGGPGQIVNTTPPTLLVGRASVGSGLAIVARITCPFTSCGALATVYLEHGGRVYLMTQVPGAQTSGARLQANDYGFWRGQIPGSGVIPGVPTRLFPDWDDHRPCIAYDYGGGGRPLGCVPGGDFGPTPQLYDPSGVITDASSGQPVVGATVTLYRLPGAQPDTRSAQRECRTIDTRPGGVWSGTAAAGGVAEDPTLLPKQIDPQINPQVTGADGRYGWNVVTGCWYVQVSAPGYVSKISALVGVPPEVTDLDLRLERSGTAGTGGGRVWLPQVWR